MQSRQNKVVLLQDKDRDGVAEIEQTFGDRNNNLDQPLGVTFANGSFYVELSRRIVDENQVIAVENLNVKGMVRNPKLALAISNVSWGMLNTMLKYKAEWAGKVYMQVDRFFPSSKLHNKCLYRIDKLPLDVRFWDCPNCGEKHIDRDINAAQNI